MKKKLLLIFILFSLIIISLPITATAANYKKAYRKEVNKFEKEKSSSGSECIYNLIYIDGDRTPELVCHNYGKYMGRNFLSYMRIYTFYKGKSRCLFDFTVYNTPFRYGIYYKPKENSVFFRSTTWESHKDSICKIIKGKLINALSKQYVNETPPMDVWNEYKVRIEGKYSKKTILKKL